jgi:hypothetical protein
MSRCHVTVRLSVASDRLQITSLCLHTESSICHCIRAIRSSSSCMTPQKKRGMNRFRNVTLLNNLLNIVFAFCGRRILHSRTCTALPPAHRNLTSVRGQRPFSVRMFSHFSAYISLIFILGFCILLCVLSRSPEEPSLATALKAVYFFSCLENREYGHADHVAPSIRISWQSHRRQSEVARSV